MWKWLWNWKVRKAGRILRSMNEKRLESLEQAASRNMHVGDVAGEGSEGEKEHIVGNRSKEDM